MLDLDRVLMAPYRSKVHPACIFLVVITATLLVQSTFGQIIDATRALEEGNGMYLQGAYHEALEHYQEALSHGYTSGALLFNMGNAYYRLDERGQAIRFYEKARPLLGDEPRLIHNLGLVQSQVSSPIASRPEPIWQQWWRATLGMRNPWGIFAAAAVLYVIAFGLFAHRMWTRKRNSWLRRARAASLAAALVLFVCAYGASADAATDLSAVVISPSAGLTETPDGPVVLVVAEGVIVEILGRDEPHIEVRLPNGVHGFLSQESLGEI